MKLPARTDLVLLAALGVAGHLTLLCLDHFFKCMIWNEEISFDGFQKKIDEWYKDKDFELCDPPISAQFALDLIFKTLVDDREDYPYLTTMSENTEQTNSIMLDLILRKYSHKYRKYLKLKKKNK